MEFQGSINLPLAYIDHKAIQIYLSVSVSSLFLFIALFCLELKAKHVVVKKNKHYCETQRNEREQNVRL